MKTPVYTLKPSFPCPYKHKHLGRCCVALPNLLLRTTDLPTCWKCSSKMAVSCQLSLELSQLKKKLPLGSSCFLAGIVHNWWLFILGRGEKAWAPIPPQHTWGSCQLQSTPEVAGDFYWFFIKDLSPFLSPVSAPSFHNWGCEEHSW